MTQGTMITASLPGSQGIPAKQLLPDDLYKKLQSLFSPRQVEYIAHVLGTNELQVIRDLNDALIIARIKRMSPERLARFDEFVPRDTEQQRLYQVTQFNWLHDEEYLLGLRLGHSPSPREFLSDFTSCRNGLRFRAYYTLKYPSRMTHRPPRPHPVSKALG